MLETTDTVAAPRLHDLIITRQFDAPPALVFAAWIEPTQMAAWWGPRGFTNPLCRLDARPGGLIRIDMTGPDGAVYPMTGLFHEITPPKRLVFTTGAFPDASGTPRLEILNIVTFVAQNDGTRLMLEASVRRSTPELAAALGGMERGWMESLDRLTDLVVADL